MNEAAKEVATVQQNLPTIEPAKSLYRESWERLSRIDVGDHIETKGDRVRLSYLSWTWAWAQLMEIYPESVYRFEEHSRDDSTVMVSCTVTIRDGNRAASRDMWLPVMSHTNAAIENPNARQVSDTRMRCLVKCLAMFGLGLDVYAGSEYPVGALDDPIDEPNAALLKKMLDKLDDKQKQAFFQYAGVSELSQITKANFTAARSALERKVKSLANSK